MSVMRPEGPESPRSAGLTAEKQEKGQTREARDRHTHRHTHIRVGERLMKGEMRGISQNEDQGVETRRRRW